MREKIEGYQAKKRMWEKASLDFKQAKFGADACLENTAKIKGMVVDSAEVFFCPYCLCSAPFKDFFQTESTVRCPECGKGMRTETITRWKGSSAATFAKWVFSSGTYGHYWKEVNFEAWRKRLTEKGWAFDFWEVYKQLKGEYDENQNEPHNRMRAKSSRDAAEDDVDRQLRECEADGGIVN